MTAREAQGMPHVCDTHPLPLMLPLAREDRITGLHTYACDIRRSAQGRDHDSQLT